MTTSIRPGKRRDRRLSPSRKPITAGRRDVMLLNPWRYQETTMEHMPASLSQIAERLHEDSLRLADVLQHVEGQDASVVEHLEQYAESLKQIRTSFKSLTHDMRRKLNHILSDIETLSESLLAEQQGAFNILDGDIGLLEQQVEGFEKLTSRIVEPQFQPTLFDLVALIHDIHWIWHKRLLEQRIRLMFQVHPAAVYIRADHMRLEMVIEELISNAQRYVPDDSNGVIVLSIIATRERVFLRVEDNGTGVNSDHLERIFETSFIGERGQSGQGLAMLRRGIAAHGGTVEARHREHEPGTCFEIGLKREFVPIDTLDPAFTTVRQRRRDVLRDTRTDEQYIFSANTTLGSHWAACAKDGYDHDLLITYAPLDASRRAQQLRHELKLLKELQHQHLIRVVHQGRGMLNEQSYGYVAFEPAPGYPLSQIALPLPVADVVRIGIHLADLLVYLHQQGVICRTLPPEAIFVDHTHTTLVTIWQACQQRTLDPDATAHLWTDDIRYISPEHFGGFSVERSGFMPDQRSDIYVYGVLLFELLVGRPLFGDDRDEEIVAHRRAALLPKITDLRPELPLSLVDLVKHCLERMPNRRYADAVALRQAIGAIDVI